MYSWNSLCLMLCFTRTPTAVFCPLFVDWQPPVFSYWTELSGLKVCCDCIESLYKCDENTVVSWIFHFRFELLLLLRCRLTACFFSLSDVVILNSIPARVFMHLLQLTDSVRDKFTNFISFRVANSQSLIPAISRQLRCDCLTCTYHNEITQPWLITIIVLVLPAHPRKKAKFCCCKLVKTTGHIFTRLYCF